ncbi:hypothetical protein BTGOE5_25790 [Bacillus thuringiensis]|nr:hypothetical protein IIS_04910 [Bacillus cereus VD131]MCS3600419.1 hypothetical protein [Bacillus sp. JUb91]OFC99042.1 hypothetical protein BTGOE5_25790 [Bacillus thuringiensis]
MYNLQEDMYEQLKEKKGKLLYFYRMVFQYVGRSLQRINLPFL